MDNQESSDPALTDPRQPSEAGTVKQSLTVDDPHVAFLNEAARYFEKRPTGGEDAAFWANVANAETCRNIAARLAQPSEAPAEARAERLAASLKLASDWLERRTWGHPADCDALDGSDDIIADARQALSDYNQRTEI